MASLAGTRINSVSLYFFLHQPSGCRDTQHITSWCRAARSGHRHPRTPHVIFVFSHRLRARGSATRVRTGAIPCLRPRRRLRPPPPPSAAASTPAATPAPRRPCAPVDESACGLGGGLGRCSGRTWTATAELTPASSDATMGKEEDWSGGPLCFLSSYRKNLLL